jgi:hypothetical protein
VLLGVLDFAKAPLVPLSVVGEDVRILGLRVGILGFHGKEGSDAARRSKSMTSQQLLNALVFDSIGPGQFETAHKPHRETLFHN